jgi:hypothetical protein
MNPRLIQCSLHTLCRFDRSGKGNYIAPRRKERSESAGESISGIRVALLFVINNTLRS